MFEREINLIGEDNYLKLKNSNILVIGVGGVGGYAVEALIRSGIENITLVDYDNIDISNINRQVIALSSNIGNSKVEELKKRILSINSNVKVKIIKEKINEDNINLLFEENYDYIIDACDTMIVKKMLIKMCHKKHINLITVCGMGKKLDPSKVKVSDIRDTNYDPLAKALRKYVKDEKIRDKVICVSSTEEPRKTNKTMITSMIMVPSTAGILAASHVINSIIKENK